MNQHSLIEELNYASDGRVRAGQRSGLGHVDEKRMRFVFEDDLGEERYLPCEYDVCPTCRGKGTHINPSIDCNGLTAEDFAEDPDFAEEYFGGMYDEVCYECQGRRVAPVINREASDPDTLKLWEGILESEAEYQAARMAELRMGA